jgi:hypothetical protein
MTEPRPFGERFRQIPPKQIQVTGMDPDLRNSLWNVLVDHFFEPHLNWSGGARFADTTVLAFSKELVSNVWKLPTDSLTIYWEHRLKLLREQFMAAPWYRVYECMEYVASNPRPDDKGRVAGYAAACNITLEREASGYRFLGTRLIRIVDPVELQAIDEARDLPATLRVVQQHLDAALAHLSSRDHPDYRNSIKESISAVESIASLIAGQDKADLDAALRTMQGRLSVHPALRRAFLQLYGYTNDSSGIRHALLEESNLTFDDAKFMLVACAAFVNYLKARLVP